MKKILILAANPQGTSRLRLDREVREIEEGLRRSQLGDRFQIEHRWASRPRDVQRSLLDVDPQIVHFCGHGEGQAGLVLEDETGQVKLVSTEALSNLFGLFADRVECVLLNACYAEVQANAIAQNINYVIGMRQEIRDDLAIAFSVGFYKGLGAGQLIEAAFESGCQTIQGNTLESSDLNRKLGSVDSTRKAKTMSLPDDSIPVLRKKATSVSALIELLKQEDPNFRIRASSELREMGTRISNALSANVYEESGSSRVGEGDIQSQEIKAAIPHLVALLNDQNTNVRISAADTLRWIGSKAVPALANPTLVELLKDKNPKVCEAAVVTLNFLLPDAATIAVDPVIELLKDKDTDARQYAYRLLNNVFLIAKTQAAVAPLIQLLEDKDTHVRASAAELLGNIEAPDAVAPLIELLEDKNASVRTSAAQALGNIQALDAVESLIQLLKDDYWYVRDSAAQALRDIKGQAAVDPLIQLLRNKDADVRKRAVEALGNIKALDAVESLIQLLEDKDASVRISAVEALRNISVQAAVNSLIKLLENKNTDIRASAAEALGNIQALDAVEPLIKLLEDEDEYVCVKAVEALGNIQALDAVDFLIKLLDNKDASFRASAAEALGNIQAPDAVEPLIKLLKDENGNVSESAVEALRKIIKAQIKAESLVKLLENKEIEAHVRASAAEALGNIKAQAAVDPLIKRLQDRSEDWELRLNAFAALTKIGFKAKSVVDPLVKSFLVEALQNNSMKEKFSNFYGNMPYYKRRAFFFTTIEPGTLPSLSKALREILTSTDDDYKVRYSAAFILGYFELPIDSTQAPSGETIMALKSVVNNPEEDFDIRWMSAFSLARMGQDMNQFFTENNLINPILINCQKGELLDPYTGWCESEEGGGAGAEGWAKIFREMLGGKKKGEEKK
ncbi:HEAT repeat domain-containing protein [Floridanema evergladense]|uniref:HEAT repeat domain-containing protein n=1 Tax=Floridaenema evergladense BLCC-F167 TaxID=3153639 RepID=A0ABV4WNE1_9CYAN